MLRLLLLCALAAIFACAHWSRPFPIRGQLDRNTSVLIVCGSGVTYRVVFSSATEYEFARLERDIGSTDPKEPVVFEFRAVPVTPKAPWREHPQVIVLGPLSLERGTCAPAA